MGINWNNHEIIERMHQEYLRGKKEEFERILKLLNEVKCGCTIQYLKLQSENEVKKQDGMVK